MNTGYSTLDYSSSVGYKFYLGEYAEIEAQIINGSFNSIGMINSP